MLKLNDKYYLDTDSCNYILIEKFVVQKEDSINKGKETFKNIGYYSSVESLYNGIIEKEIKANVKLLNNLKKIIALKEEISKGAEVS